MRCAWLALGLLVAGAPSGPAPRPRPLHAETGAAPRIADDLDRTVLLRGVNVNGLGEYYQEWADLPSTLPLTEDEFAAMAADGFDVVRLIVSWSRLEPQPGQIDAGYLDEVAQAVGWAGAHDIHVVLDMHQDAWGVAVGTPDGVTCPAGTTPSVGWDGAPAWATALVGTVATCHAAPGREFSIAVQTSFEDLYLDVGGVRDHLVAAWAALAARFAGDATIAGYDLLNEPNPGLAIGVDDAVLLGTYYDAALDAIRAAGGTAIGFFEPSVLTGPLPVSGPAPGFTTDTDVVYAPHLYNESISPLPGTIEDGFANAATAAGLHGTTFWVGEWGWFGDPTADQAAIERYAAAEDAALVGGTWWQWAQACGDPHAVGERGHRPGCAATSPLSDGLVVRPAANLAVLTRAYPRAVPGDLVAIDSDVATGSLTVDGVARRADTSADLWVPERCGAPAVAPAATVRPVAGGFRVDVPVAAGPYRIVVTCAGPTTTTRATATGAATTTPSTGDRLPATGSSPAPALAAAGLGVLAAALRRARR